MYTAHIETQTNLGANVSSVSVLITPDNSVPLPDTQADDKFQTARQAVEVSATTALVMEELGMGFEMSEKDEKQAQELFQQMSKNNVKTLPDIASPEVAMRLGSYLQAYDQQVVADSVQMRNVVTNKLLDIAFCGDPRYELKALELIGKIEDVGLFTEKSEVTVRHTTTDSLEAAIREKVRKLIHANTTDVEPISDILDEELNLSVSDDASTDDSGTPEPTDDSADASGR